MPRARAGARDEKLVDANARLDPAADAGALARLVREAQAEAAAWTHPDQYTLPYMPGGTKFMRNPPLPLSVCYPDGLPAGVEEIASTDVNGIQVRRCCSRRRAARAFGIANAPEPLQTEIGARADPLAPLSALAPQLPMSAAGSAGMRTVLIDAMKRTAE